MCDAHGPRHAAAFGDGGHDAPRIAAVLLAAGSSTRLGRSKALLVLSGRPLVHCLAEALVAAGAMPVVVVAGGDLRAVRAAVDGTGATVIGNPDRARGIGTSLARGARACPDDIDAVVVAVCDQPGLTADLIGRVIEAWRDGLGRIVRPAGGGLLGHPVLFDRAFLDELRALDGDEGGRAVIARHPCDVYLLPVADPALMCDIDTPADLAAFADASSWRARLERP